MALSLSISIKQNSQSISNNTSNVTVSVNLSWTYGSWDWNYYTKYVTINGTKYDFSSVKVNPNRTTTGSQTLFSKTLNISHSSDGKGSVSCYASVKTATGSGTVTASNSKTLTTIPRASSTRLSASSVNMGSSVTVYTDRASSSFTHKFYYRIGSGSWVLVAEGIGASYTWTVPLSLASNVPSGISLSITVNIDTYSGSTKIGSTYNTLTCNVPASVVPSVSNVAVEDSNGYANTFEGYVQNKSAPKITVAASASYSSISQYKVTFQGNTYISSSNVITLGAVSQTGSLSITVTVTDARGRTASKTATITAFAYSPPLLSVSAIRCDSNGTANDDGAYMKVSCMASITPLDEKNSKSVTLKYKKKTDESWTTQKTWAVYSVNENIIIAADVDSSYDIQLMAADYFTAEPTAFAEISTVVVIMDFNKSGKGMAIGKVSERDGLEVDWDIKFNKNIIIDNSYGISISGQTLADYVVEQGTSGIWTYQKWSSGIIRMTAKQSSTIKLGEWYQSGSAFYSVINPRQFPFTLRSVTYLDCLIENDRGYMMCTFSNPKSGDGVSPNSTGSLAVGRFSKPPVDLDINLYFKVEGMWK